MTHMPGNAHPHMIFATDSEALDRTRLGEVLRSLFGDVVISEKPLAVEMDREGHHFSFWFDEDAEGLAERYVDFLPETARRRRLIACRTMIDMSASDSDSQARQDTERITSTLAELAGVWVFDETTKRFVGFDYGDAPTDEQTQPAVADEQPQPADAEERPTDAHDAAHDAANEPAAPSPESDVVTQTPPPPAPEPSPPRIPRGDTAVPAPSAAAEPPPEPVPTPTGSTPYDDAPAPIPTLTGPEPQVVPPPTAEPSSAYPHEAEVITPEVAQPAPAGSAAPEPTPGAVPPTPAAPTPIPSAAGPTPEPWPTTPPVAEEDETEKKGFFKRMFKNRRQK